MRLKGVQEEYAWLVQQTYAEIKTAIKCSFGLKNKFKTRTQLQEGSVHSLYLIQMVINVMTRNIGNAAHWNMVFLDDLIIWESIKEGQDIELEKEREACKGRQLKASKIFAKNYG